MLSFPVQGAAPSPTTGIQCHMEIEISRPEKEARLDRRIKIYDEASERYKNTLIRLVQMQELPSVPAQLKSWSEMLNASLKDIEASPGRKDKSKALLRYEIHLRRAISAVQESKIKANVEQVGAFEAWLTQTEEIRKRLVAILFPK